MELKKYKLSDLFGYIWLGADGQVIERSNLPPSQWRPEIRARFGLPPLTSTDRIEPDSGSNGRKWPLSLT